MEEFQLPKDFLMGTAVASVLTEGGNSNTNWYTFCEEGHIKDGAHVMKCTDHWNRYKEDISIMKELNNDTHSTSIEWSRIEPKRGQFDKKALQHYRDEISLLLKNGIKPLISLYHFSNPIWFDDIGGWTSKESVELFLNFARFVVSGLGDLVTDWITLSDSNITLICQYLWGWFPPGKMKTRLMLKAMPNMIRAHIKCYKEIHKIRDEKKFPGKTMAGLDMQLRVLDPIDNKWKNRLATKIAQYMSEDIVLNAMTTGKFGFPIGLGGYPLGKGKFYDFLEINYFTRSMVSFRPSVNQLFCELTVKDNVDMTDGYWEIYPQGIYRNCKTYYEKYKVPLYVQTGLREPVDRKRSGVIYESLKYISQLIKEGIPIKRFYIWTLVDIFECYEGQTAKLGLVENNFDTQERTIRKSGYFYGELCKNKAVTREMIDKYLSDYQEYGTKQEAGAKA